MLNLDGLTIRRTINGIEIVGAETIYNETVDAVPTSRVLEGSGDDGYMLEYEGRGTIAGIPVIAIYLLDWDESEVEDECDYDWDKALT